MNDAPDRDERINTLACQICEAAFISCVCKFHGSPEPSYTGTLDTHCGRSRRAAEVILDMLAPENGQAPAEHIARGVAMIGFLVGK